MTKNQARQWIQQQLLDLAVCKYPNDPHRQMLYQIGFLQAQLAEAFYTDNLALAKFKHCLDKSQKNAAAG